MTFTPLSEPYADLVESVRPAHGREIRRERVGYAHDGAPMEGYLAEPAGPAGRPRAVLILHAWMGVGENVRMRAEMLARLGYAGFCGDVYGAGVRPAEFPAMRAEAEKYYADLALMRGRARAAFDVLIERGYAAADIVVIGYCFGGTVALEFARTGQPCAGIVAFHPRLLVHHPSDAAAIAAPVLIASGADDDMVPDYELTAFMDELRAAPGVDWEIAVYAGAPHAFTVPGDRYRPLADARSWRRFTGFLAEHAPLG